jgi:hypothetical protein
MATLSPAGDNPWPFLSSLVVAQAQAQKALCSFDRIAQILSVLRFT